MNKNKLTSLVGFGFLDDEEALEGKYIYDKVSPYKETDHILSGSTDVSDVSWVVPTGHVMCNLSYRNTITYMANDKPRIIKLSSTRHK